MLVTELNSVVLLPGELGRVRGVLVQAHDALKDLANQAEANAAYERCTKTADEIAVLLRELPAVVKGIVLLEIVSLRLAQPHQQTAHNAESAN